jgi:hypothetical protein
MEGTQNNNRARKIKYIAAFLALLAVIFGIWFYFGLKTINVPSDGLLPSTDQIVVTLKIDTGQKSYQYQEIINKGTNVLDLLKGASQKEGFDLNIKDSSMGAFIDGIYGVKSDINANKFWTLWVNGKVANVGASQYKLADGDVVEWVYGSM